MLTFLLKLKYVFLYIFKPIKVKTGFLTSKACASTSPTCQAELKCKNPYKNVIEKLDIEGKPNIKMRDITCKSY